MHKRFLLVSVILLAAGLAGAGLCAQVAPTTATKPASLDERLSNSAAQALEAIVQREQIVPFTPEIVEFHHLWAQRVLDAELVVAKNKQERVAAAQRHLTRMKTLHEKITTRLAVDADRICMTAAEYYVVEAEVAVARESK
jgi:hypothetical protein